MVSRGPRKPGRAGLWIAAIGLAFVAASIVGTVADRNLANTLNARGERADAQIVGLSRGRGGIDGATVRFFMGGRTVTADVRTSDGLPSGLSTGEIRTVVYDPRHPSQVLLADQLGAAADPTLGIAFIIVSSVVALGGVIWWWFEHEQAK